MAVSNIRQLVLYSGVCQKIHKSRRISSYLVNKEVVSLNCWFVPIFGPAPRYRRRPTTILPKANTA